MNITDALTLSRVKGLGNKSLYAVLKASLTHGINTIEQLAANPTIANAVGARTWKLVQSLVAEAAELQSLRAQCTSDLDTWGQEGIEVFTLIDEFYPSQLFSLSDPPALLFCRGNLDLLKATKAIAVIGTRNNTSLGKLITERTVKHFVDLGFSIVSGLALGIDAIAHQATLDNDGKTVAVLVDVLKVSPSQNRELANQILINGGLLISENPPGTSIVPALFVKRDRIQAGLSLATFAIETSSNGGTMHAVKSTLAMGRKVYVPDVAHAGYSDTDAPQIEGIKKLIESGEGAAYSKSQYALIIEELERQQNQLNRRRDSEQGSLL